MPCATAPSIRRRPTPHCLRDTGVAPPCIDHRDKTISNGTIRNRGTKLSPCVYNICDIMAFDSPPADQLFVKCSRGDQSAAGEFYRRYHSAICAVAIRTVRQWRLPHLANDAVHHVYLKLWSNQCRALVAFQYQGPNSDMAYVRVLAANAASDFCKSLRTRPDQRGDAVPIDKVPAPAAEDNRAMVNLQLEDAERCLRRHLSRGRDRARFTNRKAVFLTRIHGRSHRQVVVDRFECGGGRIGHSPLPQGLCKMFCPAERENGGGIVIEGEVDWSRRHLMTKSTSTTA